MNALYIYDTLDACLFLNHSVQQAHRDFFCLTRVMSQDEIDKVGEEADEEAEAAARGLSGEELRKKQQLQDLEIQEET